VPRNPVNERRDQGADTYRRLLGYLRPYWRQFAVAIVGMLVYAATSAGFAALMEPLLDGSFVEQDQRAITWVPVAILGIFFFRGLGGFCAGYFMSWLGWRVIATLRGQLFDKYLELPTREYDLATSGELISRITFNVRSVAEACTNAITVLVRESATVLALLAVMFYHSWLLSLAFLVIGPLIALIVTTISRRFRRVSRRIQESMGEASHVIEEAVEGHRVIKVFGGQGYERERFAEVNERNRRLNMKMTVAKSASVPVVHFFVAMALAGIVFVATRQSLLEQISVGSFVSFITAMLMLFAPLRALTTVNEKLQTGIAAGESVFEMLDRDAERDGGHRELAAEPARIDYREVGFAYREGGGRVLSDISLQIRAGETVAFVGRSGSGKTTLVNLLARLYETDTGTIAIDGVDIREYSLASLRQGIAYVGQDVTLFNDTVANNIAYGRLRGTPREAVEAAARAAHADEFIRQLPQGYDTPVGENGVLLSGGQRQRLAIARALLKNAPILILDEATSALDSESEKLVQEGLKALMTDRTTLVIAHRLSTIEHADRIAVMAAGRLVEQGSHAELLARGGHYARLHSLQFAEPAGGDAGDADDGADGPAAGH